MSNRDAIVDQFIADPTPDHLGTILLENTGEWPRCDFKVEIPATPKLARHVLALANSGGGIIVIGVIDGTLEAVGVNSLTDETTVRNGLKKYLPHVLLGSIRFQSYEFATDAPDHLACKRFQVLIIQNLQSYLPFLASKQSGDDLRSDIVYVRSGTSSEPANHDELQDAINRRLETGHSTRSELDLATHIEHLRLLYRNIDRYYYSGGLLSNLGFSGVIETLHGQPKLNPNYPSEGLESFFVRMVEAKKRRIEIHLDVEGLTNPD